MNDASNVCQLVLCFFPPAIVYRRMSSRPSQFAASLAFAASALMQASTSVMAFGVAACPCKQATENSVRHAAVLEGENDKQLYYTVELLRVSEPATEPAYPLLLGGYYQHRFVDLGAGTE